MTLRTRLTLAVAAIVAAAVVTGALASDLSTRRGLRSETDKFLLDRAQRFTGQGQGQGQGQGGPDLGRPERPGPDGPNPGGPGGRDGGRPPLVEFDAVSQIINRQGLITSALADQPALPVDAQDIALASSKAPPRLRHVRVGGIDYRMVTASLPAGGAVQIARSMEESEDILGVLRGRLVGIVVFGTALAALLGWLLARRTTAPIERLTEAAEHIATTQDLTTPIAVKGSDEVGRLAASFNSMLGALATSRHQQQRLVADASHELRTPLTAIRTNIEFLERASTLSEGERQALLHETTLELTELTTLVVELVELATDARNDEPVTEVDLAGVAEDVAARFRRRAGRQITVDAADAAVVQARRSMLDRALSNLVDNALKFSDGPEPVHITVTGARIEVADRGPGLSDQDREHVFDRFYRADSARTRPGSGLGLSIVAQIAAAHGGTAALHPREGGGTIARLELPLS